MRTGGQTVDLTDQSPTLEISRAQWKELNQLAAEGQLLRNAEGPWRRLGHGNLREHLEIVIEMEIAIARQAILPRGAREAQVPAQSRARNQTAAARRGTGRRPVA